MATKIVLFITILAYSIIASQTFMYILSLKQLQLGLNAESYLEIRKLTDTLMRANFKYVIYTALLANLLLVIFTVQTPKTWLFICASIAFVALVADILLTLKGSLPINDVINSWSAHTIPANWQSVREQWFIIFQYRQIANIIGLLSLLLAAVFGTK
ncbi:hypothetical protein FHS57_000891 [Runella defluvii]|uniref:DUF1772 domain-containing protein n=1 Tax=Runella defluvii TaxID=370973 RepID=A0A7W6ENV3_9BACT|nr:hypothetical protein [Runella defluvii]MBB3836909.1 hypothetical protein [Runella defluvii]